VNIDVTMPQLGETVAEGTVARWLKRVGDQVADQEPLLEIATDKVDTEVPSPGAGTLIEIVIAEDTTVSVGTVLAVIGSTAPAPVALPPIPVAVGGGGAAAPGPAASRRHRHVHSPRVRRLAAENGVALTLLHGTGPGGRVTPRDVASAAAAHQQPEPVAAVAAPPVGAAPAPTYTPTAGERVEPMSPLRTVIADRMMQSLHTSAQLTTVVEVDVTAVVALRRVAAPELAQRLGVRLTLTAFFAKAAVEALRTLPLLNASVGPDGRSVIHHDAQHLGVAVDTERGLLVPVVRDAGDLSLLGLCRRIEDLADRTRTGGIAPDELVGGTFTLTNTGSRGALFDTPILVPGQVGILGTGAVVERPAVWRQPDGERLIAIRSLAHFALTYDHRLVDGADAARFLTAVKRRLEAGQFQHELA
jgi:2-oxoglutarate dehydrogenase E2 component (dihydrolipoamide succinyltransferase)